MWKSSAAVSKVIFFVVCFSAHTQSSARLTKASEPDSSGKVAVEVYYETLCPTCQHFIRTYLQHLLLDPEVAALVDLRLYPSGNGVVFLSQDASYSFQCQHGFEECVGNKIHACAIHLFKEEPSKYLQLFTCMAENSQASINDAASVCIQHYGIDPQQLNSCLESQEIKEIMFEDFQRTKGLEPPRAYVPWVTIGGMHSEPAERGDFMSELCSAIKLAGGKAQTCDAISAAERPALRGTLAPCFTGVNASNDGGKVFSDLPIWFEY